ncbi:MAG: DoxX-like family protein, partial [Acidimicrobiales bacterium]
RADGSRWSGLKFWADDRRSLIEAGAGYWRYVPTDDGIRFLTRFDYRPRWGWPGELADRWVFRPAFGWATAWSFDRLRLWLEDGLAPEASRDTAAAHAAAVAGLFGVWAYQGLVPKLWRVDADEVHLWRRTGLGPAGARRAVRAAGAAEVLIGAVTLARSGRRWPFAVTAAVMPALVVTAAVADRRVLSRAFNPVTLNWAVAALALTALATTDGRPSGLRPLRTAPDGQPDVGDLPCARA